MVNSADAQGLVHSFAHQCGFHILSGKSKTLNESRQCILCKENNISSPVAVTKRKRTFALDDNFSITETDDLTIEWKDFSAHFVIVHQLVSGTASEKLLQHLAYARDGFYPGILVIVTNDDNIHCEKQFQYFKRKGGERVLFVWQSRLKALLRKLHSLQLSGANRSTALASLIPMRKRLSTTRLSLREFRLIAKLRVAEKLGYSLADMENDSLKNSIADEKSEKVYRKIEEIYDSRKA